MLGMIAKPYPVATLPGQSGAFSATFPLANLINNDYGRVGRLTSGAVGTYNVAFDFGFPVSIGAAAIMWHNLGGNDTITLQGSTSATFAVINYDSGSKPAVSGLTLRDVAPPSKFLLTMSQAQTYRYWRFRITIAADSPALAAGYIQMSRSLLMKSSVFQIGPLRAELSAVDMNQRVTIETGEDRTSEDPLLIRPIAQLDFAYGKETEMAEVLARYSVGLGTSLPMFICVDLTNTYLQDQLIFGRPEAVVTLQSETYDVWKFQARVRSYGP